MKRLMAAGILLMLLGVAGCAGTQYGSVHYPVVIDTVPTHCKVWLVEYPDWIKNRQALMDTVDTARARLKQSDVTPWTVSLLPYKWVVIAMDGNRTLKYHDFNPARENKVNIAFEPR